MINYGLPTSVIIDDVEYKINKNGDYRVILDIISLLNNNELEQSERIYLALCAFYGYDSEKKEFIVPENAEQAIEEMFKFMNCGDEEKNDNDPQPKLMDWEQDFSIIVPPINKVLGYEVRAVEYLHWWTFIGAYMEISGDCLFSQIVDIRRKKSKGEKLNKSEQQFFNNNKDMVILKNSISSEDRAWLDSDD